MFGLYLAYEACFMHWKRPLPTHHQTLNFLSPNYTPCVPVLVNIHPVLTGCQALPQCPQQSWEVEA